MARFKLQPGKWARRRYGDTWDDWHLVLWNQGPLGRAGMLCQLTIWNAISPELRQQSAAPKEGTVCPTCLQFCRDIAGGVRWGAEHGGT